jgi:hypothetical protein
MDCVTSDAGAAWGFFVRSASVDDSPTTCSTTTRVDIVRSDGKGYITAADAGIEVTISGAPTFSALYVAQSLELTLLGDLNGDGDAEVLVSRVTKEFEGFGEVDRKVWTLEGRNLIPYAPTRALVIIAVADIDKDGHIDFLTRGPYADVRGESPQSDESYPVVPPMFAVHALPHGVLSATDAPAVEYARRQCSEAGDDRATIIVCERLRGRSETEVIAEEKRRGCVDFDQDSSRPDSCEKWIPAVAHVNPPLRIE